MKTLIKKEIQFYLNNPIGYIVIGLFAAIINFLYIKDIFVVGLASMKQFFSIIPWILLFFVPALSMRIFSEEKRSNTMEVLLTLPIFEYQIVASKFLALLSLLAIGLFLTSALPFYLVFTTKIYIPEVVAGYVGILLFSSLLTATSMFFSLRTKNQIIAFLSSFIVIFILLAFSSDFFAGVLPKIILDIFMFFSPLPHLQNFVKGIVDIRSVIYFLTSTVLMILLITLDLQKRD